MTNLKRAVARGSAGCGSGGSSGVAWAVDPGLACASELNAVDTASSTEFSWEERFH